MTGRKTEYATCDTPQKKHSCLQVTFLLYYFPPPRFVHRKVPNIHKSPPNEVIWSNAKVLLELAGEVLWIVESETFGSL